MPSAVVLQQVPHEGPGTITDAAARAGCTLDVRHLYRGDPLPALDDADALIVMGGPMNVDDVEEYPFLAPECDLLTEALARDVPMLGLCIGSQLIAKAAGARVFPVSIKEIGWYDVAVTDAGKTDPLFQGQGDALRVFHWHGDTYDMPAGAVLLCTSNPVAHQAFRIGEVVYGLQFHMEVTADMVREWIAVNAGELAGVSDYIDPAAILDAIPAELPRMQAVGDAVLDRWFALAGLARP